VVEHKFNKTYEIILYALSSLLDRLEREDQLFAAQRIWSLASIIQFTEILIYYRLYTVFPSEYVNNLMISPVSNSGIAGPLILESEIPSLDINDSNAEVHSGQSNWLPNYQSKMQRQLHSMCCGKIFKNQPNYWRSELQARFGKQNKKRQSGIRNLLRSADSGYWGRLSWDVILPIVSEHQSYRGRDIGRCCEDTCQLRLHYQRAKCYCHDIN